MYERKSVGVKFCICCKCNEEHNERHGNQSTGVPSLQNDIRVVTRYIIIVYRYVSIADSCNEFGTPVCVCVCTIQSMRQLCSFWSSSGFGLSGSCGDFF